MTAARTLGWVERTAVRLRSAVAAFRSPSWSDPDPESSYSSIQARLIVRTTGYPERAAALRTLMPMAKSDAELERAHHRAEYWEELGKRWLRRDPARTQADASHFVTRACAALGLQHNPGAAA